MGEKKAILIVDDEPYIRSLLKKHLKKWVIRGLTYLSRKWRKRAGLALEHKPNLIFLDVMMPKMNGYEMCEAVKKKHKLTDIHIVMLTAKGQEVDRQKGLISALMNI